MQNTSQYIWPIFFIGAFVVVLSKFGIEPALALATLISGVIWLLYKVGVLFPDWQRNRPPSVEKSGEKKKADDLPTMVDYARSFFPIFLFVLLLRGFVAEPFRIPSGSMMPTLLVGDFILVNKFSYGLRLPVTKTKIMEVGEPERGDVMVFRYPKDTSVDYIKRLVGLPGDHISYNSKELIINGVPVALSDVGEYEPVGSGKRAKGSMERSEVLQDVDVEHKILVHPQRRGCPLPVNGIIVPEGHYFVMGDNRDDSNDSRCWGFVPETNLVGKAFMIWLSLDWKREGVIDWGRPGTFIN